MDPVDLSEKDRVKGRVIAALCALAVLLLSAYASGATLDSPEVPLTVGEELTYKLSWVGMNVGTVVARIAGVERINGRDAYVIELTAKTNSFCSKIYPVDDIFISYVDTQKFMSLKHVVRRSEGRYRKNAEVIFDYGKKKAYFTNFRDGSKKVFDIPGPVQDTLSAAYYFRVMDLKAGQNFSYKVVNNEQIYELFGAIGKKVFITVGHKVYEAFYAEPYARLRGQRVEKGKASGYFSCDRLRIPLYGTVKAPLFTRVTAILVNKKEGVMQ